MNVLKNKDLTIKVNPLGAELTSIVSNKTGKEYLWQADPAFWKRHSPVLFPIVGSLWNGHFKHQGKEYSMSQHGFARDKEFKLLASNNPNEVFYILQSDEESLRVYPFIFELKIGYRLLKNKVEVIWEVENKGNEKMYFQIGAHPAFNYLDFDPDQEIKGYIDFNNQKQLEYTLIEEKGCVNNNISYTLNEKENIIPIVDDTFEKDALIFEHNQLKKVTLLDRGRKAYLSVHFESPLVGIWSPKLKSAPFICIEPWYGRCDRVNFEDDLKNKDYINILNPHEIFKASYFIEIEE